MQKYLIRSAVVSGLKNLLQSTGDPKRLLVEAGLPTECLDDQELLIPANQFSDFLELCALELKSPDFGLQSGSLLTIEQLGLLGQAMQQCQTLYQAFETLATYIPYHCDGIDIVFTQSADVGIFRFSLDFAPDSHAQVGPFYLAHFHNVFRTLCPAYRRPKAVYFSNAGPGSVAPYTNLFGAPMAFEAGYNALVFDRALLNIPLEQASPCHHDALVGAMEALVRPGFIGQVQRVILSQMPRKRFDLDAVAEFMGLSRRTLQRQLTNEGTSYRQLLEQIRARLALSHLRDPSLSVTEVAQLLGYKELSIFTRSFQRWHGRSPSLWRQEHV